MADDVSRADVDMLAWLLTWTDDVSRAYVAADVEVRGTASGDRISGFSLRETEEHACVVGFFRRRLDLHRSVR